MISTSEVQICNMALGYAGVNKPIASLTENTERGRACNLYYEQYRDQLLSKYNWNFSIRRNRLTPYGTDSSGEDEWTSTYTYGAGDIAVIGLTVWRSLAAANLDNDPTDEDSAAWWFQITRDGWAYACPLPDDYLQGAVLYPVPDTGSGLTFRALRSDQRTPFALEDANDTTGLRILLTDTEFPMLGYYAQITNPASFPPLFVDALAWMLAKALALALSADISKAELGHKASVIALGEAGAAEQRGQQGDQEPMSEFEAARES